MIWNKETLYQELLSIYRQTGQGLSGIVRVMGPNVELVGDLLDQLIEDGLVKCCDTGGSLGHPESNRFYMPTKGYNVWEDSGIDGQYSRHKGRYLHHVRKYLNIEQSKIFDYEKYYKTPEGEKDYSEWLERNKVELEMLTDN